MTVALPGGVELHHTAYEHVLGWTAVGEISDAETLATSGSTYRLHAPPGVDRATGALITGLEEAGSHWLWAGYEYVPPMVGFADPAGQDPGIYGAQSGENKVGSYHCWNRVYEPQTGRWTTPDPAMSPWTNLSEYVFGTPTSHSDPSGLGGVKQEVVDDPGFPTGQVHLATAELKCGTMSLVYTEYHGVGAIFQRYTGIHFVLAFRDNGQCCCHGINFVTFIRITRRHYLTGKISLERPRDSGQWAPSGSGWAVDTLSGPSPLIPESHLRKDSDPGDCSGGYLDQPGHYYRKVNGIDPDREKIPEIWTFEFFACAFDDNGCLLGCMSFAFSVDPTQRVFMHRARITASDDPQEFNSHPGRGAWNHQPGAQGAQIVPLPALGKCCS